jgi:hypothetical protein
MRDVQYIKSNDNTKSYTETDIDHVVFYKEKDTMLIFLNNCDIIKTKISDYPGIQNYSQEKLETVEICLNRNGLRWPNLEGNITLGTLLRDAALNGSVQKLEAIKFDSRPSEEKVVFMCIYLNVGNMSRQRADEEISNMMESYKPLRENYEKLFKGFDMFFTGVQDQETKIEFFVL